ncbi:hypothetical protein O181_120957 [Austropuccinia psidii MF-1]|uniref:Uncharacterized protein n=1 Tax=Austropuccinia psidii MF-1 TaxID=1389203 RepID=A0A9Q3Q2X7_9BASI|nr:hypothetical protein [Austropuccinia psidii MF-1]
MQLLNLETGKIKLSCDYAVTVSNPTLSMNQPEPLLPSGSSLKIKMRLPGPQLTNLPVQSPTDQPPNREFQPSVSSSCQNVRKLESSKNYEYIPYYKEAPRNISSYINEENIITGKRNIVDRNNLLLESSNLTNGGTGMEKSHGFRVSLTHLSWDGLAGPIPPQTCKSHWRHLEIIPKTE